MCKQEMYTCNLITIGQAIIFSVKCKWYEAKDYRGVGRVLKVGRLWAWQWVEPNIIKLNRLVQCNRWWLNENYSSREYEKVVGLSMNRMPLPTPLDYEELPGCIKLWLSRRATLLPSRFDRMIEC